MYKLSLSASNLHHVAFLIATCVLQINLATAQTFKQTPIIHYLLDDQSDSSEPQPPIYTSGAFIEDEGLIVIELESLDYPSNWEEKTGDGAIDSYLEWLGANNFNNQGEGQMNAKIVINNPGTYQFVWRNSIREGTSTTDSNDSWLKILADRFYGFRASDSSVVCPVDQESTNQCSGDDPEGSSGNGWFKVYRSGGPAANWSWSTRTSDSDAHPIYADFFEPGEYELQISARSKNHAIDRMVLFRSRNDSDNVTESFATDSSRPESDRVE